MEVVVLVVLTQLRVVLAVVLTVLLAALHRLHRQILAVVEREMVLRAMALTAVQASL
jgi:hypothetical protein